MDGDNVWVIKITCNDRFRKELLPTFFLNALEPTSSFQLRTFFAIKWLDQLHCQQTIQRALPCNKDIPHAALTQFSHQSIIVVDILSPLNVTDSAASESIKLAINPCFSWPTS